MSAPSPPDARRALASVSAVLDQPAVQQWIESFSRPVVVETLRAVLEQCRTAAPEAARAATMDEIVAKVSQALGLPEQERLRPVVNATGILLHTGLGRAVLPPAAADALAGLNRCCNLQIDLETGERGRRHFTTEWLLARLTGAEAALVVNNNAAATLLILAALCRDREVIVSRGQLIEIGGSYRLPDCVHQSGAKLVEVGTTNRTHRRDYEAAIGPNTAAIMRVNPSNYRITGFTREVSIAELAGLKQRHPELLVIDDLGCGALLDLRPYGLPGEPTVPESVAARADLVCFSGDKLIGGPQSGIIVGRKDLVQRLRKHPLTRILRVDKLTDLALERTLRLFLHPESLTRTHPTLRMLAAVPADLKRKAERIRRLLLREAPALQIRVAAGESSVGGGSLPGVPLPTFVLAVRAPGLPAHELARRLRVREVPVIGRIQNDEVLLDMRTLLDGEDRIVREALRDLAAGAPGASADG